MSDDLRGGKYVPFVDSQQVLSVQQMDRREFYRRFFGPSNHTFGYRVVWNKLFRRTEDPRFYFRSNVNGEDIDFLIRNRDNISKVAYVKKPLIYYRVHADSVSHSPTSIKKVLEDNIQFQKYFDVNDDITPFFIQKAWMEAFAVRHNSIGTNEAKEVRKLYHVWKAESRLSRNTSTLKLWKRLAIILIDQFPILYNTYLKLRQ